METRLLRYLEEYVAVDGKVVVDSDNYSCLCDIKESLVKRVFSNCQEKNEGLTSMRAPIAVSAAAIIESKSLKGLMEMMLRRIENDGFEKVGRAFKLEVSAKKANNRLEYYFVFLFAGIFK